MEEKDCGVQEGAWCLVISKSRWAQRGSSGTPEVIWGSYQQPDCNGYYQLYLDMVSSLWQILEESAPV